MSGTLVVYFLAMERFSPVDSCQNTTFTSLYIFYSLMALSSVIYYHYALLSLHIIHRHSLSFNVIPHH